MAEHENDVERYSSPMNIRVLLDNLSYDERCKRVYTLNPTGPLRQHDRTQLQKIEVFLEYSLHMGDDYDDDMKGWYEKYHDWFMSDPEFASVYTKYHSLYTSLQSRLDSKHFEEKMSKETTSGKFDEYYA